MTGGEGEHVSPWKVELICPKKIEHCLLESLSDESWSWCSHLQSQLLRRQRSGGLRFKASLGK
jgi:hypothetical protein